MTDNTFKTNDGQVITPEMLQTPDTAIQILILAASYAHKQGVFTEMNDIAVVDRARRMAGQFTLTERYIREHYSNLILEEKILIDEKETVKTTVITEPVVKETLTSKYITSNNEGKISIELVEVPQLKEGQVGTFFIMLNSLGWKLQPGQLVMRINNKVYVPLDLFVPKDEEKEEKEDVVDETMF